MPLAGTELRIWELDQKYGALKERLERMNIFWLTRPTSWDDVRTNRNALLAESDWTQLADAQTSLTEEQKQEWNVYRQALRDMPATYADIEHVALITWPADPTVPSGPDSGGTPPPGEGPADGST
jgi:hypothetical protein